MLYSRFPLPIYFTHGSVYMSMFLYVIKYVCRKLLMQAMIERQLVVVVLLDKIQDAQFNLNFNISMTQILHGTYLS